MLIKLNSRCLPHQKIHLGAKTKGAIGGALVLIAFVGSTVAAYHLNSGAHRLLNQGWSVANQTSSVRNAFIYIGLPIGVVAGGSTLLFPLYKQYKSKKWKEENGGMCLEGALEKLSSDKVIKYSLTVCSLLCLSGLIYLTSKNPQLQQLMNTHSVTYWQMGTVGIASLVGIGAILAVDHKRMIRSLEKQLERKSDPLQQFSYTT